MAKDPVCGMDVSEGQANDTSSHKGQRYFFCSPGCRSELDRNPERYASGTGVDTQGSGPQGQQVGGPQGTQETQSSSQAQSPRRRKAS